MPDPVTILDLNGDLLISVLDPIDRLGGRKEAKGGQGVGGVQNAINNGNNNAQPTQPIHVDSIELRFKGSTAKMRRASRYFKRMMNGQWLQDSKVHSDGLRHWGFEGFNSHATTIVLNLIHDNYYQVPNTIDFDMLLNVALVLDHLQCSGNVPGAFGSCWINDLEHEIPAEYNTKLSQWICIAAVFRRNDIFKLCTHLAIIDTKSEISTLSLPILPLVSGKRSTH
ncbi:hypothetical protein SAMD00023353_0103840 [Rosellinia necatrix]|uniref:BTB domain-containing protein n=1 Tax=Rosellinia necatrix TaxID=77044 RepID=A0A1S7UKE3_ROSNE|nr:hypothetical protein SAMD00023353_0103840 [Rosellinia necatrix]